MMSILASQPETLPRALKRAAMDYPTAGLTIFDSRGRHAERKSYAEFWDFALDRASRITALGLAPHEPVIVALPTSWEWMGAWWGVLLAGGWPVAASGAGAMAAADAQYEKVDGILKSLGARWVLSSEGFVQGAREHGYSWSETQTLTHRDLDLRSARPGFQANTGQADEVAFLQLTSGSTGTPRAVMISQTGALHNALASSIAIGMPQGRPAHEWADAMVSWLPMYHDMGLIGCLMLPIVTGLDSYLLRPPSFLARPNLWLKMLGSHGNTFVPAPNFGYQLCVERIRPGQLDGLDLSQWKAALTGAEMVRPETTQAFVEKFAPFGFDERAFMPCYGLAEATLAVTFDQRGEGVRTLPLPSGKGEGYAMSQVVSNGTPIVDTKVEIRGPNGRALQEGAIGEVCIHGPGVFRGYFRDEIATKTALRDGWFHTGDLGFLADGELYITGRMKEILIVHGHNMMPEELERIADGVTGGGGLCRSAAFSVARSAEGEEAVIVVEISEPDSEKMQGMEQDIRSQIGRQIGLPLADLIFVRRGQIPRTTSGKMQRNELRRRYLENRLQRLDD